MGQSDSRGVLYPRKLQGLTRHAAPDDLAAFLGWWWIPVWELPPLRVERQTVLPFPACNLVVEPDGAVLSGPATGVSHRDLAGRGWAVGALLRPAGAALLGVDPAGMVDRTVPFVAPSLVDDLCGIFHDPGEDLRATAVERCCRWWRELRDARAEVVPAEAHLAGQALDLVTGDRELMRVPQLAAGLGVSVRTLQRICQRHIGLPPLAVIRRYRLQEAAARLRAAGGPGIADIAAELGYTDAAHLTADFRRVLGKTPAAYRRAATS